MQLNQQLVDDLLEAACKGINEMLKTVRGANMYGSGAKAVIEDGQIKVITQYGDFWLAI